MSQRRQDARRAKQERRRELRQEVRQAQRRTATATDRPRPSAPPPASGGPGLMTPRNRLLIFGGIAAVLLLLAVFFIYQNTVGAPLPGEQYPSQGNDHLTTPDAPHPPYNSNPPTSGWHLPDVPRPGIYTQPRSPESLGHFMEHGGIWVLYNCPDGCPDDVAALQRVVDSAIDQGKPVALAPYLTMESRYAAVAWRWLLPLDGADTGQVREFIDRHQCNYNPEGGPYCTGVRGKVESPEATNTPLPVTVQPFSVFSPTPGAGTPAATGTPVPTGTPAATATATATAAP